jgi:sulfite exporter TauE/SafE
MINAMLWWLAGGLAVFACLLLAFDRVALFELLNGMVVAVAAGIIVGFGRAAIGAFLVDVRELSAGDTLILGIMLLWVGLLVAFLNLWAYRLTSDPYWLTNVWTVLSRGFIFAGGVLHLAATGAIDNRVPPRAYVRAGIITAFGVAAALFTATI